MHNISALPLHVALQATNTHLSTERSTSPCVFHATHQSVCILLLLNICNKHTSQLVPSTPPHLLLLLLLCCQAQPLRSLGLKQVVVTDNMDA
jgi:hypothetical protein